MTAGACPTPRLRVIPVASLGPVAAKSYSFGHSQKVVQKFPRVLSRASGSGIEDFVTGATRADSRCTSTGAERLGGVSVPGALRMISVTESARGSNVLSLPDESFWQSSAGASWAAETRPGIVGPGRVVVADRFRRP